MIIPRPCHCDLPGCEPCRLAREDPRYQKLWGIDPEIALQPSQAVRISTCTHFGDPTGELLDCPTCNGKVSLKLFRCTVYGECTAGKTVRGVACCAGCKDYSPSLLPSRPTSGSTSPPPVSNNLPLAIPTPRSNPPSIAPTASGRLRWAYGVTTVLQRRSTLLPRTLESLRLAGFDAPRLFVDGANGHDDDAGDWLRLPYEKTFRYPRIRAYGNWILGLGELLLRDPKADRYAMFQDDFVTYPNLRAYLEATPYPTKGYLNLYTFPSNQTLAPVGKTGFYSSDQLGKGAVALVFDRDAVVNLITNEHMVNKARSAEKHYSWKSIDGGVVSAMKKAGYKEYVHNPSLVQHLGENTTLNEPGFNHPKQLQAISFRGENFDALSLLQEARTV